MAQSLPNRTPQAAYSPRYLDPIQEQRILSWRSHASPTSSVCQSPSPSVSPAQSKSSGETCTCGYATSICSCSSKRKKRKARSYYKRSAKTTSGGSVDRPGGPDFQQVHGQRVNPPPQTQFGPGPTMPMPEPTINIPQLPRIAGTRDPLESHVSARRRAGTEHRIALRSHPRPPSATELRNGRRQTPLGVVTTLPRRGGRPHAVAWRAEGRPPFLLYQDTDRSKGVREANNRWRKESHVHFVFTTLDLSTLITEMPSRRDRSASPRRNKDRARDREGRRDKDRREHKDGHRSARERERSSSEEELIDIAKLGLKEINEEDYFLKSSEFKNWLKEAKSKYLDELSSEAAHKYFRRFVRRWNDGALEERFYFPPSTPGPSSSNTAYQWSFANNRSRVDKDQLSQARAQVSRETHGLTSASSSSSRPLGPSLPTSADRQLALESDREAKQYERKLKGKEQYSRADELVPKNIGREGKLAERKAVNEENRKSRDKDQTAGLEVDEATLLGGNDSFAAALASRNAAAARRNDRKSIQMAERRAADEERLADRKSKESATMDMFKALAKQRFG
ncbi:hypothetical protein P7C73_g683, partial [Tremellales sp. Uapishka_1]